MLSGLLGCYRGLGDTGCGRGPRLGSCVTLIVGRGCVGLWLLRELLWLLLRLNDALSGCRCLSLRRRTALP